MKIVGSISAPMPAGTQLTIQSASNKGLSLGSMDVSNALSPVDLVAGVNKGSDQDQSIRYVFSANADVPSIPSDFRIITLTLTN
jgi:hypothetical protein